MPARSRLPLLVCALVAAGCSSSKDAGLELGAADSTSTGFPARLDVHPAGDSEIQPQSFPIADIAEGTVAVTMASSIVITGTVTGYEIAPMADVEVPGNANVPVQATVRAHLPGTIVDVSTSTDRDGEWQLELPAGQGYVLSVHPEVPAPLPLSVETDLSLLGSQRRDLELDAGVPVFGQVAQTDGAPLPDGAQARLRHDRSGVEGLPTTLSSDGRYLLRALPGEYTLIIDGERTSAMPTIELPLEVSQDDTGIEQNLSVGTLDLAFVEGRIFDAEGDDVDQVVVRFHADSLDGGLTVAATATHETTTNNDGEFRRGLLPGQWTVEVIPPFDDDGAASPLRFSLEVEPDQDVDLGNIELPRRTTAAGLVTDASGNPVSGAIVSFTERGFDGHTYSQTTRGDGQFTRRTPAVPMELTLVPPTPNTAVTRLVVEDPSDLPRLELDEGVPFSGKVEAEGAPLDFALIEVYDDGGAFLGSTVTNGEGSFQLRVLAAPDGLGDTGL